MQILPRWRNVFHLRNALIPTFSPSITYTQFASIHSTPSTCEKWKNKWNNDVRFRQQSKNVVRYTVRQKRRDTKRALKDLLYNTGAYTPSFQDEEPGQSFHQENANGTRKKRHTKSSAQYSRKSDVKKMKRKFRRGSFSEDSDGPETVFQATYGNRWYTWSFGGSTPRGSTFGFEWREPPNWKDNRGGPSNASSESDSDDEPCSVGSSDDRIVLGLPPSGPLTIKDVKDAFRLSALKWHPDKHQGASQTIAEEKFKLCVNAYKALCAALS